MIQNMRDSNRLFLRHFGGGRGRGGGGEWGVHNFEVKIKIAKNQYKEYFWNN